MMPTTRSSAFTIAIGSVIAVKRKNRQILSDFKLKHKVVLCNVNLLFFQTRLQHCMRLKHVKFCPQLYP
eukprot:m.1002396 g.1002396  ORF g.1002396 m.1002396 type:complete len:69 (-) comp24036_c0_seq9:156-362(-)